MIPNSRASLKDYCLRKLGHPVIEINVDDDQLEDRVDEALQLFRENHFDGVERIYLKHQITSNTIADGYVSVDDSILSVNGVFPTSAIRTASSTSNLFSFDYQFKLTMMEDLTSGSLIDYDMMMKHVALIDNLLVKQRRFTFNKHGNKIYLHINWNDVEEGDYLVFECYKILDPEANTDVYGDSWLTRYVTALFKYQWGSNISKYDGVQMPGGITFNGRAILDDAQAEILALKEELKSDYMEPPAGFML